MPPQQYTAVTGGRHAPKSAQRTDARAHARAVSLLARRGRLRGTRGMSECQRVGGSRHERSSVLEVGRPIRQSWAAPGTHEGATNHIYIPGNHNPEVNMTIQHCRAKQHTLLWGNPIKVGERIIPEPRAHEVLVAADRLRHTDHRAGASKGSRLVPPCAGRTAATSSWYDISSEKTGLGTPTDPTHLRAHKFIQYFR